MRQLGVIVRTDNFLAHCIGLNLIEINHAGKCGQTVVDIGSFRLCHQVPTVVLVVLVFSHMFSAPTNSRNVDNGVDLVLNVNNMRLVVVSASQQLIGMWRDIHSKLVLFYQFVLLVKTENVLIDIFSDIKSLNWILVVANVPKRNSV